MKNGGLLSVRITIGLPKCPTIFFWKNLLEIFDVSDHIARMIGHSVIGLTAASKYLLPSFAAGSDSAKSIKSVQISSTTGCTRTVLP